MWSCAIRSERELTTITAQHYFSDRERAMHVIAKSAQQTMMEAT